MWQRFARRDRVARSIARTDCRHNGKEAILASFAVNPTFNDEKNLLTLIENRHWIA